ncbi:hypothetical protein DFH09DRAFT_1074320 [Mycena vulgaris]|nr:hypothetical protein DFH09DRAFT_1074320 [Mycena vulgaris]
MPIGLSQWEVDKSSAKTKIQLDLGHLGDVFKVPTVHQLPDMGWDLFPACREFILPCYDRGVTLIFHQLQFETDSGREAFGVVSLERDSIFTAGCTVLCGKSPLRGVIAMVSNFRIFMPSIVICINLQFIHSAFQTISSYLNDPYIRSPELNMRAPRLSRNNLGPELGLNPEGFLNEIRTSGSSAPFSLLKMSFGQWYTYSRRDSPRSAGYGLSPEMLHINPRRPTATQFIQRLRIDYNKWSSHGGLAPRTACNRISPPARQLAPLHPRTTNARSTPSSRLDAAASTRDALGLPAVLCCTRVPITLALPHYGEVDPRSPHPPCLHCLRAVRSLRCRICAFVTLGGHVRTGLRGSPRSAQAAASFSGPYALDTAQQDRDGGNIALGRLVPVLNYETSADKGLGFYDFGTQIQAAEIPSTLPHTSAMKSPGSYANLKAFVDRDLIRLNDLECLLSLALSVQRIVRSLALRRCSVMSNFNLSRPQIDYSRSPAKHFISSLAARSPPRVCKTSAESEIASFIASTGLRDLAPTAYLVRSQLEIFIAGFKAGRAKPQDFG